MVAPWFSWLELASPPSPQFNVELFLSPNRKYASHKPSTRGVYESYSQH